MVTWDEHERVLNIESRGLDFVGCEIAFDQPVITREDDQVVCGQTKISLLGLLCGLVVPMTCRGRGDIVCVISSRRATKQVARCCFSQINSQAGSSCDRGGCAADP